MAASTTTRLQLFLDMASELGDLITLTATATGTTTTLISSADMIFPDGSLNGREAWFASGTAGNVGKRRLVIGTDQDAGSITVHPALPSATASADVVHLVNSRGTSVTIPEIHNKINQLNRQVRDELATEVAGTPATFDMATPGIAIPTAWNYVLGVQVEDPPSLSGNFTPLLASAWTVSVADRKVFIKPMFRGSSHNKRIRLIGTTPLADLTTDASTTPAPAVWIAKCGAAELLEAAALRTGDVATAFTYGELLKAKATQVETYIGKRFNSGKRVYVGATT